MRQVFDELGPFLESFVSAEETCTAYLEGEESDFVRFNHGKVRQPGTVRQLNARFDFIVGKRHALACVGLSGDWSTDEPVVRAALEDLRSRVGATAEDPLLVVDDNPRVSETLREYELPSGPELTEAITSRVTHDDFVGILAAGPTYRGFVSTLGHRLWFQSGSYNLDFSLYLPSKLAGDKAAKGQVAGARWDVSKFEDKLSEMRNHLEVLGQPPKTLDPGRYRVYLAPAAVSAIFELLAWDSFGLRGHRTKQTALLQMLEKDTRWDPRVTLAEDIAGGVGPDFSPAGFARAPRTELISGGKLTGALVSPRSAREFEALSNGAADSEVPEALAMAPGEMKSGEILKRLGTGLWVNNLWYLNYSDRAAGRMTGMTRFATFWVEDGVPVGPVNVMRFDETVYHFFGTGLEGIDAAADTSLDPGTYFQRSTSSVTLPGILVDGVHLTL